MGGRYWITGVQLGMLQAFSRVRDEWQSVELINKIIDKQFIKNVEQNKHDLVKRIEDIKKGNYLTEEEFKKKHGLQSKDALHKLPTTSITSPSKDETDLDITNCRQCGEEIVIMIGDLEHPICQRVNCFKSAFPDDWEQLQEELKEYSKQDTQVSNSTPKGKWGRTYSDVSKEAPRGGRR